MVILVTLRHDKHKPFRLDATFAALGVDGGLDSGGGVSEPPMLRVQTRQRR